MTNDTRYCGRMLHSIFLSVVKHVEGTLARNAAVTHEAKTHTADWYAQRGQLIRRVCDVTYVYTRNRGCSGRASLGGLRCRIRIPRDSVPLASLAWLMQHEVYHLFGVTHRDMPPAINHWSDAGIAAARETYATLIERYGEIVHEVAAPEPRRPTITEKRAAKLASIEARITRWESKAKRAENALKKLRKQRRYYASRLGSQGGDA